MQGMLTETGEIRWHGFIIDQSSKVTILLQMVAETDADLYLFYLDQETYTLSSIGGSTLYGLGTQEFYCDVLDAGIYYIAVSAYEGSGQYAFAFYATQDTNYEANDSKSTAAEVSVNSTITGVIDTPYDVDYYKFTLSSPAIMNLTADVSDYGFGYSSGSQFYKISQYDDLYEFEAGTYYFAVYSSTGAYDANKTYKITFNKIANIADDANEFYYMVNEKAYVVFQCDLNGGSMYVNGNPIDISYSYKKDISDSWGIQSYSITLNNTSNL